MPSSFRITAVANPSTTEESVLKKANNHRFRAQSFCFPGEETEIQKH